MAKLSANVAAFALIALSIGFNMWRYPVVWDMVGGSPCLSQSNQSEPSTAMTKPNKSAVPTVALQAGCRRLPGGKQCELTEGLASDEVVAHRMPGQLVAVVRPMGNPNEVCPPESAPQVVRLPSVDLIAPVPASRSLQSFAEHQLLSYPTTGIE